MFEEELPLIKLFISHLERDDEEYQLFLSKLDKSQDFKWEDTAVQDENSIEQIIEQMKPVNAVIILSGLIGKDELLLKRQIKAAQQLEKPIVVIRPYGLETVPFDLEGIASEVVGWNTPCIVDAIQDSIYGNDGVL